MKKKRGSKNPIQSKPSGTTGFAVQDEKDLYQYQLVRTWGKGPLLYVVLLNPGLADNSKDDHITRRLYNFSKAWGFTGFVTHYLFAYRSADYRELLYQPDPVGPANLSALKSIPIGNTVLCGWGGHVWEVLRSNSAAMELYAGRLGEYLQGMKVCLGVTATGHPYHPVYRPANSMYSPYAIDFRRYLLNS